MSDVIRNAEKLLRLGWSVKLTPDLGGVLIEALVPHACIQTLLSQSVSFISEDAASEDAASEDAASEDAVSEDAVSETSPAVQASDPDLISNNEIILTAESIAQSCNRVWERMPPPREAVVYRDRILLRFLFQTDLPAKFQRAHLVYALQFRFPTLRHDIVESCVERLLTLSRKVGHRTYAKPNRKPLTVEDLILNLPREREHAICVSVLRQRINALALHPWGESRIRDLLLEGMHSRRICQVRENAILKYYAI